jgi:hypothetical protein
MLPCGQNSLLVVFEFGVLFNGMGINSTDEKKYLHDERRSFAKKWEAPIGCS